MSLTIKPKAMKRFFLSLTMLAIVTTSAFASDDYEVSEKVKQSFKKEFAGAQYVQWAEQGDYMKATFVLAGSRAIAYFSQDGELEGSIRNIFFNQLPLAVITSLNKKFEDVIAIDIAEISNVNGTNYRLTLESKEKKYRVKVDPSGNITDVDRVKS